MPEIREGSPLQNHEALVSGENSSTHLKPDVLFAQFQKIVDTSVQGEANKDALEYAMNLVANKTSRLRYNFYVDKLLNPAFVSVFNLESSDMTSLRALMEDMQYLTYDKKEESQGRGNYHKRAEVAKEVAALLAKGMTSIEDEEFTKIVTARSKTLH